MYVFKQMQSERDLLNHFGQLLAPQIRRIRSRLIEYPKWWSVSHQHARFRRDLTTMPAYRFAEFYVKCPVIDCRLYRRSPEC